MIFKETELKGAYIIDLEKKQDDRGFFSRIFCIDEFANKKLKYNFVQINNSFNKHKGTLRGLHYQLSPKTETKLIRCIKGSIYDVFIDLRPDSPSYGNYISAVLSEKNKTMAYIPDGFAHGFITLEDETEIIYFSSEFYEPTLERGIKFDDPYFKIEWPDDPKIISEKDTNWKEYNFNSKETDLLKGLL